MSWNDFKVFLVEEFCPSNEMEKPENAPFRMGQNQRACNECGSLDHLRYDCPKWKQATGQARNPLSLEGNRNTRNNGNRSRGGAFNENAVEALQDPKVLCKIVSKLSEVVKHSEVVNFPQELQALPVLVSSVQKQLMTLDSLPSLLNKVIETLNRFTPVVENASKDMTKDVPSASQATASPDEE
ncbi:putative reverse transcriptase domain-containing protein [Tanacetum coccineum]